MPLSHGIANEGTTPSNVVQINSDFIFPAKSAFLGTVTGLPFLIGVSASLSDKPYFLGP